MLILCSGLSFHNMSAFFSPKDAARIDQGRDFDRWLNKVMTDQANTAVKSKPSTLNPFEPSTDQANTAVKSKPSTLNPFEPSTDQANTAVKSKP